MVPLDLDPEVYKSNVQFLTLSTRILLENTITPEQLTSKYGKSVLYDAFLLSTEGEGKNLHCLLQVPRNKEKFTATQESLQKEQKWSWRPEEGLQNDSKEK